MKKNLKKSCPEIEIKKITFPVLGPPVPYTRVTKLTQHIRRQWKRYVIYKAIVALSFAEAITLLCESLGKSRPAPMALTSIRELKTHLIESLTTTTNKTSFLIPGVIVEIELIETKIIAIRSKDNATNFK